jgi:uridine monophosphate synthetase
LSFIPYTAFFKPLLLHTDKYGGKGAFFLCKTSNPGSNDFLALNLESGCETLFERIARLVGYEWSSKVDATLGLVVGATDSDALKKARRAAGPDVWILAPGVGAQGGDLRMALLAGCNASTASGMLVPVSRGISQAKDMGAAAKEIVEQIQLVREEMLRPQQPAPAADNDKDSAATTILQQYQKEFIEFSLAQGVLRFGSFTLKSGRTSPYFFNAGLFASGAAVYELAKAYASTIMAASSEL